MLDKENLLFKPEFKKTYSYEKRGSATADPTMTNTIKHTHFQIFKDKFVLIGSELKEKFLEYKFVWKKFVEKWGGICLDDNRMAFNLIKKVKSTKDNKHPQARKVMRE